MLPLDRWVALPVTTIKIHVLDQAALRCRQLFSKANVPCIDDIAEAWITMLQPLHYRLVIADNGTLILTHSTFPPLLCNCLNTCMAPQFRSIPESTANQAVRDFSTLVLHLRCLCPSHLYSNKY